MSRRTTADAIVLYKVLQQHGVDIFADVNWDTYIFFAIKARLSNNSWSTPTSESISSLFSFFNHSCEANVEWKSSNNLRTMIVSARRDIARGEQLFVCYDGFAADQPLEARRSRFWKWINGPCQCSKCLREEDELRCSVDSSPTKSAASEASRPSPAASWDTEIKPILPEDGLVLENDMVEPID